jgi:hypothetical protein
MVANKKDAKDKKQSVSALQGKMLDTYEREGSDFLDKDSEQRRMSVEKHEF